MRLRAFKLYLGHVLKLRSLTELTGKPFLNSLGNLVRDFRVMIELHGVLGAALAHGTERADVTEHVGQRHHGIDDARVAALIHAAYLSAAAVQIADDVTHVVFRSNDLDLHHRLQKLRPRLAHSFAKSGARRDFKGHDRRVHVMMGSVV